MKLITTLIALIWSGASWYWYVIIILVWLADSLFYPRNKGHEHNGPLG